MADLPAFGAPARRLFQLEDGAIYLNHGSYGATPKAVTLAQRRWQDRLEAEPSRFMEREFRPGLRVAAERLSAHLGVTGRSVAMVENATQAVNAILRSLSFKPGDEILINDQTYNAVKNTVRWVASRSGAKVVEVALPFPAFSEDSVVGIDRVRQHNHQLAVEAGRRLAEAWGTEVGSPAALTGSMITVRLPDGLGTAQAQALELRRRLLDERRIQVPINALAGGLWARVSAQIYTQHSEIDALAEAVLVERRNAA